MKKMNGFVLSIACAIAINCAAGLSVSAEAGMKEIALNSVKVMVNGKTIEENNIVYNDRTYVPLRATFETIGCKVDYDDATQTASITGEVRKPNELIKTFTNYEEEYEALKQRYDILISNQTQKGNATEVEKLQNEFTEKVAALKDKYSANSSVVLEKQLQYVEFNAIKVVVNGTAIQNENILFKDRTFVPLRAISEFIGCDVVWDEATRTAFISGELIPKNEVIDVYTSYEEEYALLKADYDKRIAAQLAAGKEAFDNTMKQSSAATGGQVGSQTQLADAAAKPFYDRAEELRQEFARKDASLKEKYKVAE